MPICLCPLSSVAIVFITHRSFSTHSICLSLDLPILLPSSLFLSIFLTKSFLSWSIHTRCPIHSNRSFLVSYLLLLLALQPTVGFSLLSDFFPFCPFFALLSPPSYSHYSQIFFSACNPSLPWSPSSSHTCRFSFSELYYV